MKRLILFCLPITVCSHAAFSQEEELGVPVPQLTEQHQLLQKDVGAWEAEMKIYMAGPDSDPMVMKAVESNQLMNNGLWLTSDFKSGPFVGHGQFGYDPLKKKYVGTWIDNMNPHLAVMEGEYDSASGELVMYTDGVDPQTQEAQKMKSVTKYASDDEKSMVMYTQDKTSGKWVKSFEINYKRKEA